MKQVIRLTESDIHGIVKQIINETLNEHGIGLVGMHQAAADNLKNRHRLGQRHRRLPNGKIQNNKERFNKAKQQIKQEIMDEYFIGVWRRRGRFNMLLLVFQILCI